MSLACFGGHFQSVIRFETYSAVCKCEKKKTPEKPKEKAERVDVCVGGSHGDVSPGSGHVSAVTSLAKCRHGQKSAYCKLGGWLNNTHGRPCK